MGTTANLHRVAILAVGMAILPSPVRGDFLITGDGSNGMAQSLGLGYSGAFSATFAYQATSSTSGFVTINLTNTSTSGGFLTAFAFNNPGAKVSGASLVSSDSNFTLLGGPSFNHSIPTATIPLIPLFEGYGKFSIGAGLPTLIDGHPVGNNWYSSTVAPSNGLGAGQTGMFTFLLTGTGLNTLTTASFLSTGPQDDGIAPGGDSSPFIARFRGFRGDLLDLGDKVPVSSIKEVPEPATLILAGMGIFGLLIFRRPRQRGERHAQDIEGQTGTGATAPAL